jgi:outer membrane immunogenic protein
MKKVLQSFAVTSCLFATLTAVQAADLPVAPVYQPAPAAARVYNWTGFYLGVNGGYGWGSQDPFNVFTNRFDAFSVPFSGGLFGGTFGAQIQSGRVVMGVEADIDWASIKGSATVIPTIAGLTPNGCAASCLTSLSTNIDTASTARMRIGYAQDNWLFYATGGLALLGANTTVSTVGGVACTTALLSSVCTGTSHRVGAAAGAGVEYGFTPNLSMKIEYLYVAAASLESSHLDEIRAGLNFRFGGM